MLILFTQQESRWAFSGSMMQIKILLNEPSNSKNEQMKIQKFKNQFTGSEFGLYLLESSELLTEDEREEPKISFTSAHPFSLISLLDVTFCILDSLTVDV